MISTLAHANPAPGSETARLRSLHLNGPAGRLEALLNEGTANAPFAALVCHPHPTGGGTMHNKVVYHAMKALNAPEWGLGWPVLRFNFRGTGLSEGTYNGGAEVGDVLAALDWLGNEYMRPLIVVGFSFGAAMALHACCGSVGTELRVNVHALAALGLPTRADGLHYEYPFLADCSLPKLFLSGDSDQYAPVPDLHHVISTAAEPRKLVLIPGADHFFTGQLTALQSALSSWLKEDLQ
jgi:uncharacterized protein